MRIVETAIVGVSVIESQPIGDSRGRFCRLFCDRELESAIGDRRIVQINQSVTAEPGTVRGMHFQHPPSAEFKIVRCLRGRVLDVAVDLRAGSETFLAWHAEELTPENTRALAIPEGCAHGFQTLEPDTELLYLHTAHYAPEAEGGLRHDDPALRIHWPLPVVGLSERDSRHPLIDASFSGVSP